MSHDAPYGTQDSFAQRVANLERFLSSAYDNEETLTTQALLTCIREQQAALEQITNGMEAVAEAFPDAISFMPGLKWMPEKARAVLAKYALPEVKP